MRKFVQGWLHDPYAVPKIEAIYRIQLPWAVTTAYSTYLYAIKLDSRNNTEQSYSIIGDLWRQNAGSVFKGTLREMSNYTFMEQDENV
jgi:hypothetical protein